MASDAKDAMRAERYDWPRSAAGNPWGDATVPSASSSSNNSSARNPAPAGAAHDDLTIEQMQQQRELLQGVLGKHDAAVRN